MPYGTDLTCTECKTEFVCYASRWNGRTECPHCQAKFIVEFDFIVMEPDYEEWDLYELQKISEEEFASSKDDLYESAKA